jgi:four helix bundle protein
MLNRELWLHRKTKIKIQKMEDNEFEVFELNEVARPYRISHRCYFISKDVIMFVSECKYANIFRSLFEQLVRSATSIGVNVVEGRSGSSKKDWKNFYIIALKSANEAKYWLEGYDERFRCKNP